MTEQARQPEPGDKYVRGDLNHAYHIIEADDETVRMWVRRGGSKHEVEKTRSRFDEEVADGNVVWHPPCRNCDLAFDPDGDHPGVEMRLCYSGWYEQASVRERCEHEGGWLAGEALRSGDPKRHLLDFIGDPVNTFHDRSDAEVLLMHRVTAREMIDAWFRCPNCMEGEQFPMVPETGEIVCHCGEQLKPPDGKGAAA